MPARAFEPEIPTSDQPHNPALERYSTGTGKADMLVVFKRAILIKTL